METLSRVGRLCIHVVEIVLKGVLLNDRVSPNLLKGGTPVRVDLQHTPNEVFSLRAQEIGHLILSPLRSRHHHAEIGVVKW